MSYLLAPFLLAACQPEGQAPRSGDAGGDAPEASQVTPVETAEALVPPMAEQRPHVVSAPAGDRDDPWYWLRDDERSDPDMLAYLEAENAYADARLAHLTDLRAALSEEMRGRIREDDSSVPYYDRGFWYYTRYEEGLEYPIYARRQGSLDADEEIILNVNEMAEPHAFYQVGDWDVSADGRFLAFLEDTVGRRQFTIRIKDLSTGEIRDTEISDASSLSWSNDNRYLFYVSNHPETLRSWQVRRLDLDDHSAQEGVLVYQEDDAAFYTWVGRSTSDQYNMIFLRSTVSSEMHVLSASRPLDDFTVFYPRERDHEYSIDHLGEHWIIRTNHEAPNFQIMRVGLDSHADRSSWEVVIAHDPDTYIHGFDAMERFLAIAERSDGLRRIRIHHWATGESELLTFDEPAYAAYLGANTDQSSHKLRFVYTSMTTPTQTWDIDLETGERELLKQVEVPGGFDSADYVSERIWVEARDGARVPVSILRHVNTPLDGTAPLYQYGYGSYGASMDPTFATGRLSLVDRGFVFAIAHIRGGQEMGRH